MHTKWTFGNVCAAKIKIRHPVCPGSTFRQWGRLWDPSDGNAKCLSWALTLKHPLGKVYAFHQPHKKCLKPVTVKLPKPPPQGFVRNFLFASLLNKWKGRGPFLKPNSINITILFLSASFLFLCFGFFSADKSEIVLVFSQKENGKIKP